MTNEIDNPDPDDFTDPSPLPDNDADLAVLGDLLQERGINKVVIRYAGSGDSGSVEDIELHPKGTIIPQWAEDRLSDLADGYCPAGYENNEGGYGTLTIFPIFGLAELEHHDQFEDAEDMPIEGATLPEELLMRLRKLGIVEITAEFDGCGDSGLIQGFEVLPMDVEIGRDLQEEIEDFVLDLLPGGWEIDDGSYGTFTIDGESGAVTAEAASRFTEDETFVTRFKWRQ